MNLRIQSNFIHGVMLLALVFAASHSRAAVITVGVSGCDYTDLAAAISDAEPNDELRLRAQTFTNVNLNLFDSLTIRGGYQTCGDPFPGLNSYSTLEGDPGGGDSVIEIESVDLTVNLTRLIIRGGTEDSDHGGGIDVASTNTLVLATVIVEDNESDLGGGIYLQGGATLRHAGPVTIRNNTADHGAGIYADAGAMVDLTTGGLNPVELEGNVATLNAGGLYLASGASLSTSSARPVTISDGTAVNGGGIYAATDAVIDAPRLALLNNDALTGGGLFVAGDGPAASGTNISLGEDARIVANEAIDGGGIYLADGAAYGVLIEGEVESNVAVRDGGGVFAAGGALELTGAELRSNDADVDGGGIYTSTTVISKNALITNNEAGRDGGGWFAEGGLIQFRFPANNVNGNVATSNGGGIALTAAASMFSAQNGGPMPVLFVANNRADTGNGGGLFVLNADFDLEWLQVGQQGAGNQAPAGWGGGIYVDTDSNWSLINSRVHYNVADAGGGLVSFGDAAFTVAADMSSSVSAPTPMGTFRCDPFALPADTYCSEFRGNVGNSQVGGVYLANLANSDRTFDGVAFIDNDGILGSAFYAQAGQVQVRNALFTGNGPAAALRTLPFGGVTVSHSSFVDNLGSGIVQGNGSTSLSVLNSLFWSNDGVDVSPGGSGASFSGDCNLSQDGTAPGLMADPRFIETARGRYRLSSESPALDACVNSNDTTDLDGVDRPTGVDYDIGAFEGDWGLSDVLFANGFEL